jgi:hypothetical protein
MVYLDYRIAKIGDKGAQRQRDIGVTSINALLPDGTRFDSVTAEGSTYAQEGDLDQRPSQRNNQGPTE